jgi:hypothetical protein
MTPVELNEQPFAPTLAHKLGDGPHVSGLLRRILQVWGALVVLLSGQIFAADYPAVVSTNFVIHDFKFHSGEVAPDLRIHYRTPGTPGRDANGVVTKLFRSAGRRPERASRPFHRF